MLWAVQVKIDGVDIRDVPRSELRSNFGMVSARHLAVPRNHL